MVERTMYCQSITPLTDLDVVILIDTTPPGSMEPSVSLCLPKGHGMEARRMYRVLVEPVEYREGESCGPAV